MTPGRKDDASKPRFYLLPPRALLAVVKTLTFGGDRYGDDNWKRVPDLQNRYLSALGRHVNAFQRGEWSDRDSGLPHLAHAICCALFILEDTYLRGRVSRTRPRRPRSARGRTPGTT